MASDSEKAKIDGFQVTFCFDFNKRRSNYCRQKMGTVNGKLINLLLKKITKLLKRNNHFLFYFIALLKNAYFL